MCWGIFSIRDDSDIVCVCHYLTAWVEFLSVAVTILLISNLWINPTIGRSTPSSVRDSVIAMGSTLLKAPSMSRKAVNVHSMMLSDFSMLLTTECTLYL